MIIPNISEQGLCHNHTHCILTELISYDKCRCFCMSIKAKIDF